MRDTRPEAAEVQRRAILAVDPGERLRMAIAHSESIRELALDRLRSKHPGLTTLELVEILLGEDLIPRDHPARRP